MNSRVSPAHIEPLEARIAPATTTTQIAQALDLPAGTTVTYTGAADAVAAGVHERFDFPSGSDSDFLILSTGKAANFYKLKDTGDDEEGTDFAPKHDPAGDEATVEFTLDVPTSSSDQRLKFDVRVLTEEFPDFAQTDAFKFQVLKPGVGFETKFGLLTSPGSPDFTEIPDPNPTYLNAISEFKTVSYPVPAGISSLTIRFVIKDAQGGMPDGFFDTTALIDNVRFETPQVVFLNFDGGNIPRNFYDNVSVVTVPAFDAADVKSMDNTTVVIDALVNKLRGLYAAYDIKFVTTPPAGDYMTMFIGGDNATVSLTTLPTHPAGAGHVSSWQTYTKMQVGSTLFGRAQKVDIGNFNHNDLGIMFSGVFDDFYSAEDPATILNRLSVTLAHEIGHNLGLRHLDDSIDNDVMAQFSPRSPSATFIDASGNLAETWDDGATTQNDKQYLAGVLGTEGSLVSLFQQSIQRLLSSIFASLDKPVYDASVILWEGGTADGDDPDAELYSQVFELSELSGPMQLDLPVTSLDAKISIYGSSTPGGPTDVFTGNPAAGTASLFDSAVPLFDVLGGLNESIDLSIGTPGNLQPYAKVTATQQNTGTLLPGGKDVFIEPGNDIATVTLTGPGEIRVLQSLVDFSITQITLSNTDPAKSALSIKVKGNANSDGLFKVGTIIGTGVKSITAPKVDINGAGVALSGAVGKVVFHDIENGADLNFDGGGPLQKAGFTAHDIEDGTTINFDTSLSAFKAARVGEGSITAAAIASLKVSGDKKAAIAGDFESDVTLTGGLPAKNKVLGSAKITGKAQDVDFVVAGSVGSFSAGIFKDSTLFVGFTPTTPANPMAGVADDDFTSDLKIGSFKAAGIKGNPAAAFVNSTIAAFDIGAVTLGLIDPNNSGVLFGVLAANSIGAVTSTASDFKFDKTLTQQILAPDFQVKIV